MKDENFSPLKWKVGRIVNIHQGADGSICLVDIEMTNDSMARSHFSHSFVFNQFSNQNLFLFCNLKFYCVRLFSKFIRISVNIVL